MRYAPTNPVATLAIGLAAVLSILSGCGTDVSGPQAISSTAGAGGSTSVSAGSGAGGAVSSSSGSGGMAGASSSSSGDPRGCTNDFECGGGNAACFLADICVGGSVGCNQGVIGCSTDDDCLSAGGPFTVCRMCPDGYGICDYACTTICDLGWTCDADHCVHAPCQTNADCPANFVCTDPEHVCVRRTCGGDAECDGYCVSGWCIEELGFCHDCT